MKFSSGQPFAKREMETISVRLYKDEIEELEKIVYATSDSNRSRIIRKAIKEFVEHYNFSEFGIPLSKTFDDVIELGRTEE